MYRQKLLFSLLLIVFYFSLLSQNSGSVTEDKYTPNTSSIFTAPKSKSERVASEIEITIKNSIRFAPTFMVRQKLVCFYERDLVKGLALNFGIGKAFGKDWMQDIYFMFSGSDYSRDILAPSDVFSYSEFQNSSVFLAGGAKIYFSGQTFRRGYFELFARHEKQTYLMMGSMNGYEVLGDREFTFRTMNYGFGFGVMGLSGSKKNITHDFFMNVGFKFIDTPTFTKVEIENNTFTETIYINTNSQIRLRLIPAFNIGYAFGFGW